MRRNGATLASLLLILVAMALIPSALAAETTTFSDHFTSYDTTVWFKTAGTDPSTFGGTYLNASHTRLRSAYVHKYCNFTWVGRPYREDKEEWIGLTTAYYQHTNYTKTAIYWVFRPDGTLKTKVVNHGTQTENTVGGYDSSTDHTYTIIWEEGRVRFYFDGTLNDTITTNVPDTPMVVTIYTDTWASDQTHRLYIDQIIVKEDREATFDTPDLSFCNSTANDHVTSNSWNSSTLTRTITTAAGGTYWVKVYIPTSYRSYFAEVKKDGAVYTNVAFRRATRELSIKGLTTTTLAIKMVDPPEWLVDFSYWFMAATGVSLAPLLKLWDRLAKIHKLLPYLAVFLGLVFLCFAVWFTWQWISFQASHTRF